MKTWAVWLASMVEPLAAKLLLALGFEVVTITGFATGFDQLKSLFVQYVGQVPADGFQLALLAGAGPAFGMIFGAIAFRLAMWKIQSATRIVGKVAGGA